MRVWGTACGICMAPGSERATLHVTTLMWLPQKKEMGRNKKRKDRDWETQEDINTERQREAQSDVLVYRLLKEK